MLDKDEISDLRYDLSKAYGANPYIENLLLRADTAISQLDFQLRAAEAGRDRLVGELERARWVLALAKSMILSGERMSDPAREMIDGVLAGKIRDTSGDSKRQD